MGRAQCPPCFQCRCRKVRCDRRKGRCGNCERLHFPCSFEKGGHTVVSTDRKVPANRPERRRGAQACIECRHQKVRCTGELPECANCQRRRRPCHYPSVSAQLPNTVLDDSITQLETGDRGEHDQEKISDRSTQTAEFEQGIDDYFEYLYPIPSYAFLHEPSTRQQYAKGTLHQNLVLSMTAVAKAVLSPSSGYSDKSQVWIAQVEMDIWNQLEKPNIVCLQSLLLVIQYYIRVGRFSRAYMLAGLAARGATALRLNHERPELSFVAQETRRRVLWALSSIDGSFSVGLPEYETIPHTVIYQRLPCSEEAYQGGQPTHAPSTHWPWMDSSDSSEGCNLFSACIRVSKISKDIMRLTRQLALSEQPLAQLGGLIQEIQNDLWRLQTDIELSFQYQVSSPDLVTRMTSSRWFVRYLQVSITWHQAHCDLYRLFLSGFNGSAPKIITDSIEPSLKAQALEKCQEHVRAINCIIRGVLDLSPPPVLLPPYVAVCAYHATRLTLFLHCTPGIDGTVDLDAAIEIANTSLATLQRFFAKSASAEKIILDMQHLVDLAKMGPESVLNELRYPLPPFDQGPHRHSHLAVHSLIRQANFIDGGYENYDDGS